MKENKLGNFELTQPIARISDPCYDKSTWCAGTVENCKTGTWQAKVYNSDEGEWGMRVGYLIAFHSSIESPSPYLKKWGQLDIDVGVDAGMAGIFDDKYFKDDSSVDGVARLGGKDNSVICADEPWYSICCDRSMCDVNAGVIPYGCNSSSGYGDGSYVASAMKNSDGEVVGIMIDFGLEQEDEDDTVECSNCLKNVDADQVSDDGFCFACYNKLYEVCSGCDEGFPKEELKDRLCPACAEEVNESLSY